MINVKEFILNNYTEYTGDETFLCGPTNRTRALWEKCQNILKQEKENGGVLDIDTTTFSGINNFTPGYIDESNELIIGLQTDSPLKRIINPYGGMRMVEASLNAYNYQLPEDMKNYFQEFRKTHNQGVFDAYTPEMRLARHTGLLTGLPDAYGRGRIIGDYRRVALYGINYLIEEKKKDFNLLTGEMLEETIRLREELSE